MIYQDLIRPVLPECFAVDLQHPAWLAGRAGTLVPAATTRTPATPHHPSPMIIFRSALHEAGALGVGLVRKRRRLPDFGLLVTATRWA